MLYICIEQLRIITQKLKTMKAKIIKTETIEATEFSMESNIIELDSIPTVTEQEKLFENYESIILEF